MKLDALAVLELLQVCLTVMASQVRHQHKKLHEMHAQHQTKRHLAEVYGHVQVMVNKAAILLRV